MVGPVKAPTETKTHKNPAGSKYSKTKRDYYDVSFLVAENNWGGK